MSATRVDERFVSVSLKVPGVMGKPRPRFGGHAYADPRWRAYKAAVQAAWADACDGERAPAGAPVSLRVSVATPLPRSVRRPRENVQKPDIDNVLKAIMDGLSRDDAAGFPGAWDDDRQVTFVTASKAMQVSHDTEPHVDVAVSWEVA